MRSLTSDYLEDLKFSATQLETLNQIGAYHGKQALYVDQLPLKSHGGTLRLAWLEQVLGNWRVSGCWRGTIDIGFAVTQHCFDLTPYQST